MQKLSEQLMTFLELNAVKIIVIIVLFLIAKTILSGIIKKTIKLFNDGNDNDKSRKEKRADTLGCICLTIGNTVIYIIILFMLLSLFDINITPLIAGTGIIGLAIGFGAQALVKDFVSGLFILIEDQYNIGDSIKIGGFSGEVIDLTLRSTVLKDKEGGVYYIQNGTINNIINLSKK